MRRWMVIALVVLFASPSLAQRICLSPDSIYVDSTPIARTAHLFIYVPQGTGKFIIGIFDQIDDDEVSKPSSFTLFTPDNKAVMQLTNPQKSAWSEYEITVDGKWGIWRLTVTGPQPKDAKILARNCFMVRTVGDVDLFVKPEPAVLARGLRFSEPRFGGEPTHRFTVQVPEVERVRFNFSRPREVQTVEVHLQPPEDVTAKQLWGGLSRSSLEFLEVTGTNLSGLWRLTISNVKGVYALGIEQELRVFFTEKPLMPMPMTVNVTTIVADENAPIPARFDIASPQTATETYVAFTDRNGVGRLFLLPDITYQVRVSRGFEYETKTELISSDTKSTTISLKRLIERPKGWYCGDTHTHTVYSDGNDTPAQMVEAAMGEGLDWFVLTDHGAGSNIKHVLIAHEEAIPLSEPGKFVVIPGEEFSAPSYHANIINGVIEEPSAASLQQAIDAVMKLDSEERPMTIKINHPHWTGTPKTSELVRQVKSLPLIEQWNDGDVERNKQTTMLWWELLNNGIRVFAETGTDSHNRKAARLGNRRTYVYLGDAQLTAANIVRALRNGRSSLSRGALLIFTANGLLPGDTLEQTPASIKVVLKSTQPIERVEIVHNGNVIHTFSLDGKTEFEGEVTLQVENGWLLVQAFRKDDPIPLAMANPIFVQIVK